ncbi:MAG: class I SAM-dependent methyltransferase, partial [Dehalococcoidia bacterium]|nr:class I SAM-dependent methyltransferase [Dehalococcoidia bacterium]
MASPTSASVKEQFPLIPFTDFSSVTPETKLSDLNLNWRERDLPEKERTKHVHRLHPYLGKFIPQLVEIFLRKYQPKMVVDPFSGSGTTLVEASALGIGSFGCDISEFNCLLARVKTDEYDLDLLEREILDILGKTTGVSQAKLLEKRGLYNASDYLTRWFASEALCELLLYRDLIPEYRYQDVLKIILSRSARSARLTTHFDLDFPKAPKTEPYQCYKHSRICQPTRDAKQFLTRYSHDTIKRIREFSAVRTGAEVDVVCADSRHIEFPECDLVLTSPPYVGLIDYHE